MNHQEFNQFQAILFDEIKEMSVTKGKEYANSENRFDNFNRLSQRLGIKREQVLYAYLTKHLDAIESYIKNGRTFSQEGIEGRILDALTYLTLLAGMIHEDRNPKHSSPAA